MDVMEYLAQLLGITPEYSVTRGWQPVDQGTLKGHQSLLGGYASMLDDPFVAALMGQLDPSTFDPVVTETPIDAPEAPQLSKLPLYQNNERMSLLVEQVAAGSSPREAAELLIQSGVVEVPQGQEAELIEYYAKEAEALQPEIEQQRQYEDAYAQWEANPVERTEEESSTAKMWREAGLRNPFEQFEAADFDPGYEANRQRAMGGYEPYLDAMQEYLGVVDGNRRGKLEAAGREGMRQRYQQEIDAATAPAVGGGVGEIALARSMGAEPPTPAPGIEGSVSALHPHLHSGGGIGGGGPEPRRREAPGGFSPEQALRRAWASRAQGMAPKQAAAAAGPTPAQAARQKVKTAHAAARKQAGVGEKERAAALWQAQQAQRRGETPFMHQAAQILGYGR